MGKRAWVVFSGVVWFAVGVCLLLFGVRLIALSSTYLGSAGGAAPSTWAFSKLCLMTKNREYAACILVTIGLLLGFLKGRLVLSKTAKRISERIYSLPQPLKISQVYSLKYLALIGLMVVLGIGMRWLPMDMRGTIDVAIGSALMQGAVSYFHFAFYREREQNR